MRFELLSAGPQCGYIDPAGLPGPGTQTALQTTAGRPRVQHALREKEQEHESCVIHVKGLAERAAELHIAAGPRAKVFELTTSFLRAKEAWNLSVTSKSNHAPVNEGSSDKLLQAALETKGHVLAHMASLPARVVFHNALEDLRVRDDAERKLKDSFSYVERIFHSNPLTFAESGASALLSLGRFAEAERVLRWAIASSSPASTIHCRFVLGRLHMHRGEFQEARNVVQFLLGNSSTRSLGLHLVARLDAVERLEFDMLVNLHTGTPNRYWRFQIPACQGDVDAARREALAQWEPPSGLGSRVPHQFLELMTSAVTIRLRDMPAWIEFLERYFMAPHQLQTIPFAVPHLPAHPVNPAPAGQDRTIAS